MVRRNSIEASTRSSMVESELIRGSESPYQADLKFLSGEYYRLVTKTSKLLAKTDSMEAKLAEKFESMESKLDTMLDEVTNTLSQLCNQLGIRPIEAETSRQTSPVTFSDAYVRDDHNRLPLDNRKSLLRKIELPKFDGSNAHDWLSKVERIFRVGRYSDSDKLDLVALSLEGDVLKWFNWQLIRREFRSWEDFRRRLFRKFGAAPAESPGNRLFAIKQTGTVSASVTELEELSAQVIEQQTVYKEDSITQLQVPVSKLEHSLQIHIESPNVCEHVVGCAELGTDTDVSAYVTKSEELSSQVVGLDASHLEQIFDNGLPTEMKEVWKLKESMGLENQKKSRCLKASRFNFKRKKKRIKRWFNTLSCRESWRKHKHENLQLVSGLVGFNVGDFRCHKEYGLARLGNWSQVRVEYSLLQGELFCKNTLPRKPATSSSMLPLYVYQMGVSDIQDNAKEMVADPVSLQLTLDVNKTSKTLDNQRTFTPTPVASVNSLSFEVDNFELCVGHDKDIMRLKLLLHSGCDGEKLPELDFHFGVNHGLLVFPWNLMLLEFFLFYHLEDKVCLSAASNSCYGWMVFDRGKNIKISGDVITRVFLDLKKFLCEKVHRVSFLSLAAQFNTLEIIQDVLEQILQGDDEDSTKIIDKLQIQLKQGMNLHGASWHCSSDEMNQFLSPIRLVDALYSGLGENDHALLAAEVHESGQQQSSSIWHRWRRKDCTRTSSCVLPLQFSFFKLEDKLVLRGESIDTIHQSYHGKKKQVPAQQRLIEEAGDVAEASAQGEDSGCERSFAVESREFI